MRVLFIGNSYTYVNDLPMVVADLAAAAHEAHAFKPDVVLVGGATLEGQIAGHDALPALARGGWDAIVLQEQSTRPITAPDKMWRDIKTLAGAHSALFRDDGSHPSPLGTYLAATVLYETLYRKSPVGLPAMTRN